MKKHFALSLLAHGLLLALIVFIRWPHRSIETASLIPVDIVTIAEITQSNKPYQQNQPEEKPATVPEKKIETPENIPVEKPETKPTPPLALDMPKEDLPEAKPEEAAPEQPPEKEAPKTPEPVEEPQEEPAEETPAKDTAPLLEKEEMPQKKEEAPTPPSVPKEKPKVPETPKKLTNEEAKKKKAEKVTKSFQALFKNLLKTNSAQKGEKAEDAEEDQKEEANGDDLPKGKELTISERDALSQQLRKCWGVDAGAKNAKKLAVAVHLVMNPDGTVKKATVLKSSDFQESDPFYQAAARRALNAVRNPKCAKLKLPLRKYKTWKEFVFDFDPEQMAY